MLAGILHQGSGLGNQLFRYIATRVVATDKGYEWGMIYNPDGSGKEEGFKGKFFLEQPRMVSSLGEWKIWDEKKVIENGIDIRPYDPDINFVQDNYLIDGEFQDPRYFEHRMADIAQWLAVKPLPYPTDLCVIGFRGGEYALYPDLFLRGEWWSAAIQKMRDINPSMQFEVHTDDPALARQFFPDFTITHHIEDNWRSVRYAKYAIIANSSFFIMPRLLQHHTNSDSVTIAPRGWARHNIRKWALPQNYYKQFLYQ